MEAAWRALRDAIIQGDDEAFFELHSARTKAQALADFPLIRSRYMASPEEEREAFRALYRVTDAEFRNGEPRDLVVRMAPWRSGWRARMDLFRRAEVGDVRIAVVTLPDGTAVREGRVLLDITRAIAPGETVPEGFKPTVVFVRDPEGWRRRDLFPGE
ncbi:MAG: hypothetical protein L6R43_17255 [Planctomycetes bacterium]|nr:hypothetical protein [Planctomycetota bacterium]